MANVANVANVANAGSAGSAGSADGAEDAEGAGATKATGGAGPASHAGAAGVVSDAGAPARAGAAHGSNAGRSRMSTAAKAGDTAILRGVRLAIREVMPMSAARDAMRLRAPRYRAIRARRTVRTTRVLHHAACRAACLVACMLALLAGSVGAQAATAREALCRALVTEPAGLARVREPLTFGVPFQQGVVHDVAALRCWRVTTGAALPVQARVLSRWPDGSVRWALVDTQLALEARGRVQLAVGRAADLAPTPATWQLPPGIDLATSRRIVLGDGTTEWPLIERGAPGTVGGDRVAGLAPRLVDRFGHLYGGVLDLRSVQLLESGPLRLCFLIRGEHRSLDGKGLAEGFHTFAARVSVLAGCERARVQWTLENSPLTDPPGALAFRSYELLLDPTSPADTQRMHCVLPAVAPRIARITPPDETFLLRQNGPTPDKSVLRLGDKEQQLTNADDLWAGVLLPAAAVEGRGAGAPEAGISGSFVHRFDSAHNHPAAFLHGDSGPLRVAVLPESKGAEFWLDDATQKTFRLDLARIAGDLTRGAGGAAALEATADAGAALMARAGAPALVALDPGDVAASLAWGDTGLMYVPDAASTARANLGIPPQAPTGWTDWGEWHSRNTHTTGSPRNLLSVYLEFMQSGRAEAFAAGQARAFHAMDLRPFHIRGFRASDFPRANLYEGTPHVNEQPANRLGRSEMSARFPEYKTGLPPAGHGYNGFDSEHMTLDDIYECWLLTGDWVAHDALVSAGEAMLTWHTVQPGGDLWAARNIGWTLRALVQVHRATGERRYLDAAADMVARADRERGHGAVKYLRKGAPDPRHIADATSEAPWMVAIAIHGLCAYWAESHDPAVPPLLTDLVSFVMSGYRGEGWLPDLPTEGGTAGARPPEKLGTSLWIPGALGAAAFVTGDHDAVDLTYPYYTYVSAQSQHSAEFGGATWSWWQPWLVSVQSRYGEPAVRHPSSFRLPAQAGR